MNIIVDLPYLGMFNCTQSGRSFGQRFTSSKDKLLLCLPFQMTRYTFCLYLLWIRHCPILLKNINAPCLVIFCSLARFFLHKSDGISNCVCGERGGLAAVCYSVFPNCSEKYLVTQRLNRLNINIGKPESKYHVPISVHT